MQPSIPTMGRIQIVREVPHSVEESWGRITDWPRHGDFVPLTMVRATSRGIVGRTSIGPLGFDDTMDIARWDPPRHCRLEKTGRIVRGWAEIDVEPSGTGSKVTWTEDVSVAGVPRFADPVQRFFARKTFGHLIDGLLA